MRLFVAVIPPRQFREELAMRLDRIRDRARIAWIPPENWHITLAFLGDWPAPQATALVESLRDAIRGHQHVVVKPGAVDGFPTRRRPRVLFLHLSGGDALTELAASVRAAAAASGPDGHHDDKDFRPHLTLARIKRPLPRSELTVLQELDLGSWAPFLVDTVSLVASELRPAGARYNVQAEFALATD